MKFESSNVQLAAAEKLQAEATAAIRKRNFNGAIDKLTEAINMQPPILMGLLDTRAALYDKTEKLKLALKDAKTMMGQEKANPKGYLRAGKVLHRLDKADLAIEVYKLGIKHAEPSDPQLPRLKEILEKAQEKHNKVMRAAAKKVYDPMQVLPLELLEMVLSYLPFQNIVAMQRVSKTWQRVISSNARFWTTLDFSRARKSISKTALKKCINKSKYTLTKAILNRIHNYNDTTLIDMVSICKDLEYMKVMDGLLGSTLTRAMQLTRSLKTLILHCQIPFTTLDGILHPEVPLEHLECLYLGPTKRAQALSFGKKEACTTLKRLLVNFADLESASVRRLVEMESLVGFLPNLQELQLNKIQISGGRLDMTSLEKLETFVCRNSGITSRDIRYPSSLKVLDVACTTFAGQNTAENQETLPRLKMLNVTKSNLPKEVLLDLVPPYENQLTHLRIGWANNIRFEDVLENYLGHKSLEGLEELSVEGDYEYTNRSVQALYDLPCLRKLNFSSTSVNGSGVYQLISNGKSRESLKEVIMNGIDRVSSDLVKFAGDRGVRIIQVPEGGREWQLLQGENSGPFLRL
ncbi:hypothetical protein TWF225_011591 [Orbilia oligospora]|uniref:Uncharacterized protein n=1 Tax=Orbilia oligospora TaxID=2813651 RepID=A0A7C8P5A4_ORBOL|nr:hypothetical protein TWF751_010596 [Orbilia oligospora]KAF3192786.1 hypothetical protein TWF225_011591 [Orbilia oligospora]KAF3247155.1 hypothetical protein TWF128_008661 [Orbilia oligospora]KAF3262871.1 hypothetical protein TWF217_004154 [Orbilia oligospora]KAF3287165.1 hypothetical protein TWF132_008692 [Orbilia oligospora]